jgi:hypothetical protein
LWVKNWEKTELIKNEISHFCNYSTGESIRDRIKEDPTSGGDEEG